MRETLTLFMPLIYVVVSILVTIIVIKVIDKLR